jgi:hypothetical protein
VYGPVRTVVWQGSVGNRRPYADLTRLPETDTLPKTRTILEEEIKKGRSRRAEPAEGTALYQFFFLRVFTFVSMPG